MSCKKSKCFTDIELDILIDLVEVSKNIVENKSTNAVSNNKKVQEWDALTERYNSTAGVSGPRTKEQLRRCWENVKTRCKKARSEARTELLKTGGGPMRVNIDDPIMKKVERITPYIFLEIANDYDGNNGQSAIENVSGFISESSLDRPAWLNEYCPDPEVNDYVHQGMIINGQMDNFGVNTYNNILVSTHAPIFSNTVPAGILSAEVTSRCTPLVGHYSTTRAPMLICDVPRMSLCSSSNATPIEYETAVLTSQDKLRTVKQIRKPESAETAETTINKNLNTQAAQQLEVHALRMEAAKHLLNAARIKEETWKLKRKYAELKFNKLKNYGNES